MPRFRRAAIAGLVIVPLFAGGFLLQEKSARDGARLLDQVLSLVSDRFVDTLDASALYEKAARGLVKELSDPYSELLSPKQLQDFKNRRRTNDAGNMTSVAQTLNEADIENLAHYITSLR